MSESTDIRPVPSDEEAVAIVAALSTLNAGTSAAPSDEPSRWRWAGRWWSKPVPLSRARPW